jgi:HD-GYP domain-containing protein (c-di-GMP phosphodiesterase class II)
MIQFFGKIKLFIVHLFLQDFIPFLMPRNQRSMLYWREYLFNIVFFVFFVLNSIAFLFSSIRMLMSQSLLPLAINLALYAVMIVIVFSRRIPFHVRSYVGCFIFFGVGLFLFYTYGPLVGGLFWFFLFSSFNASFNGIRGVIFSNLLIALTIVCFIIIIPVHDFQWVYVTPEFYRSHTWWLTGVSLFFLNLVISVAIAFFMYNLEKALVRNTDSRNAIIFGLASLTEYRDTDMGRHLERISKYCMLLARELRKSRKYKNYITDNYLEDLEISSILHDIGKVGIEDKILRKNGKLSIREFEKIKLHPVIGGKVIESINNRMKDKDFLKMALHIIVCHHEKWDGSGYPKGLHREEIPLSARIVALADVYDALISKRTYKVPMTHEEAVKIIVKEKSRHFDPEITEIFRNIHGEFKKISTS